MVGFCDSVAERLSGVGSSGGDSSIVGGETQRWKSKVA